MSKPTAKDREMPPIWASFSRIALWSVTAIVFLVLAFDSFESMHLHLVRYRDIDVESAQAGLLTGKLDVVKFAHAIVYAVNGNADSLEESLRRSSRVTLTLNLVSAAAAILGFFAELRIFRHERKMHKAISSKKG